MDIYVDTEFEVSMGEYYHRRLNMAIYKEESSKTRVLYYNWVQFDNANGTGGGVNVYQKNLIDSLINKDNYEIYFLSSGWKYNPLKNKPYIRKTKNVHGEKCKTFEIINSPIMSPAFAIYMHPSRFIEDKGSVEVFDEFIKTYGPFDVIHFNNIEGISINVLSLKEKYPETKFIVSIHNYQPICPLVQYFQNHNNVICHDFKNGTECLNCSFSMPSKTEYAKRCKNYMYDLLTSKNLKFLKPIGKIYSKLFQFLSKNYVGNKSTMIPRKYALYRRYNVEILNKYADSILAVSKRVGEILIENGVTPEKVKTSYIGTKFAEIELKHSIAKINQPFTICYLGYERIDKGFFFLIDTLSKIDEEIAKKINVVLAVANIHKNNVFPKLDKFNNVTIYNGYSHDQLKNILSTVNLGIVPVLWEDNLPQVAIEMVACGVPILCSSFGGASELCNSELFKFKGADEKDFIDKLTKFIENPELLNEYWSHHPNLTTMEKHIEELERYYV